MTVADTINHKLQSLQPQHLKIDNESHMHSVPANSETHFRVELVSSAFVGKRPVQRHQMIYQLLQDELAGPVHALALHTYAPDEWQGNAPQSPACRGGSQQD